MRKRQKHPQLPNAAVSPSFLAAFVTIVSRIETSSANGQGQAVAAGSHVGIAVHFIPRGPSVIEHLSHRMLPRGLERAIATPMAGRGSYDRQYNDSFGLLHEDAYRDSIPSRCRVPTQGDRSEAVARHPVSSCRFADHDRDDIEALAACGLIKSPQLRKRAEEAMRYIGDPAPREPASERHVNSLPRRAASRTTAKTRGSSKLADALVEWRGPKDRQPGPSGRYRDRSRHRSPCRHVEMHFRPNMRAPLSKR